MPNHWNAYDNPEMFEWWAALPVSGGPEPLLRLQRALFDGGERHQMLRVDTSPEIGFDRNRDGYIGDFADAHPDRPGPLDEYPAGYVLSGYWQMRYSTRLAYAPAQTRWAASARVEEDWFDGTSELGERAKVPVRWNAPPIQLFADVREGQFVVAVSLMTDIFFPLNPAAEDWPGTDEVLDNRPLAERNGGRLNAFLADLQAAALAQGGRWGAARRSAAPPWRFGDSGIVF
ncbi:hypothetical protein [Dactylosporangium darangshiense]|uniref:hypothetical protein n=1 Tax=Dactylosporangium darangshiense TaxID=579108 RepID=UPI0031E6F570